MGRTEPLLCHRLEDHVGKASAGSLSPGQPHSQLSSAQVPFWNGCNEDEHCVPDLVLDAHSDLPTAM